jgi:thiamine kinase-like enzyme
MFEDTKHTVETLKYKNRLYIKRSLKLDSQDILEKEYLVQKSINHTRVVPRVFNFRSLYYFEEIIDFRKLYLTNENIQNIAAALYTLHNINVDLLAKKLQASLKNHFLDKSGRNINYVSLYEAILKELTSEDIREELIRYNIQKFLSSHQEEKIPAKLCLIHGDLNKGNVLLDEFKNIKLIDWSDCRIDEPAADVAQLFYHFKFTTRQAELFFNTYPDTFIAHGVLEIRKLFLLLYDVVFLWKTKKRKASGKLVQIRDIILNK